MRAGEKIFPARLREKDMLESDTIAAIATGMGTAGIGIIRISGAEAFAVAERIFVPLQREKKLTEQDSYTAHYGNIVDGTEIVDEVIVLLMKGPHSYTAEDTVEIDSHGGICVMKRILELVLRKGARAAQPGEFTKRAFLNGRIDLSQAEAVMDVIQAKNEYALKSSVRQLKGSLLNLIRKIREQILYEIAFIESALDDPEHISLDGYPQQLQGRMKCLIKETGELLLHADQGRILREGIQTVLTGKPNAGKSSVLNVLAGDERAIVTEVAGTTRDTLEEQIQIRGLLLNIIDTAGIRQTDDVVEKIGVNKARKSVADADLVLYVVDSSTPLDENDLEIASLLAGQKVIVLLNKTDLPVVTSQEMMEAVFPGPIVCISAKEETGFDQFSDILEEMFLKGSISYDDEMYLTNVRQRTAMAAAKESLEKVRESIELGMPEDFFSIDLMDAYQTLGSITGESAGEDLVNEIFSRFCVGK